MVGAVKPAGHGLRQKVCFPPEPPELMRSLGSDPLTYAENLKPAWTDEGSVGRRAVPISPGGRLVRQVLAGDVAQSLEHPAMGLRVQGWVIRV